MARKIHAYLNFNGNCEEAFKFYEKVFETENIGIHRYGDMPSNTEMSEETKDKVLNMAIMLNDSTMILGSDIIEGFGQPFATSGNQSYIMLDFDNSEETQKTYTALSENAKLIEMPLERTFFAELYAAFQDQFGIFWMIHFEGDVRM